MVVRGRARPEPGPSTSWRSDGSLPAVFHCSAGKDRTGVLSALILAFVGVPDETIVEDYALSAAAMVRLLERLKAEYPDSVEEVERYAPAVLQVMPETMEEFLSSVRGRVRQLRGAGRVARGGRRRGPAAPGGARSPPEQAAPRGRRTVRR